MWFKALTGFDEESPEQVRENLSVKGPILKSLINNKEYRCGTLDIPSLAELRDRIETSGVPGGRLSVHELVADVRELHLDPANAGALFQVASQFNLLEMISPSVTPEQGVTRYAHDSTQGPTCAIAAGAGTIYRNYFAAVNGQIGQTADNQIDCLADLGRVLGNHDNRLWTMQNGYALASAEGLQEIGQTIRSLSESERDELRKLLRIGIQWDTQVTLNPATHLVTQAYCSALPVAYCHHPAELWADFAGLILEASYEASLCAAVLNALQTGNNKVYLTLIGGGVFGNRFSWITDALKRSLNRYQHAGLDVAIVSYARPCREVGALVSEFNNQ